MAITDTASTPTATLLAPATQSERSLRWARLRRKLLVWIPAGVVAALILVCFVVPAVFPLPKPVGGSVLDSMLPPGSDGHPLGTDVNGNDVLSRILYGGQASLTVAISVNAIGIIVGGSLGALSGSLGGRADTVIMRILDVLIAFPSLVLTIAIAQVLGPSLVNTIIAMCAFSIPSIARVARSAALRVVSMPFFQAAELAGSSRWRILTRHVAPNVVPQLLNFALLGMGIVIVTEGALSFLGLGIPAPEPSWGNMIYDGQQALTGAPLLVLWPSLALLVTVLSFNLLGENLRDEMSGR
ncbi:MULTISPECIES: ABC transporter permease [unclassified Microbacterium]|uniref:ABC transporter permease n=1 Tax=unclassified Microbacterium TaxID=2609290 RepID=UPI00097F1C1B|nr:ABC transporter permease [Microbacterium sp. JB110]RCS60708.1 ABC transporter permease [Microbacterium sp. JB110]SJM44774.1 Dipeptide transport system permease protein DppC (TC 3.A.1.5.2) [Frigoribacterium sp. JB110]